jgi:hypothetical protein
MRTVFLLVFALPLTYADATVTVPPIFRSHLIGPQYPSGSCSPGVSYGASELADLRLTIRDLPTDSADEIDSNSAGQGEVAQFMMKAAGEFTVEICADPGEEQPGIQEYNLSDRLKKTPVPHDLNPDRRIDGTDRDSCSRTEAIQARSCLRMSRVTTLSMTGSSRPFCRLGRRVNEQSNVATFTS